MSVAMNMIAHTMREAIYAGRNGGVLASIPENIDPEEIEHKKFYKNCENIAMAELLNQLENMSPSEALYAAMLLTYVGLLHRGAIMEMPLFGKLDPVSAGIASRQFAAYSNARRSHQ